MLLHICIVKGKQEGWKASQSKVRLAKKIDNVHGIIKLAGADRSDSNTSGRSAHFYTATQNDSRQQKKKANALTSASELGHIHGIMSSFRREITILFDIRLKVIPMIMVRIYAK